MRNPLLVQVVYASGWFGTTQYARSKGWAQARARWHAAMMGPFFPGVNPLAHATPVPTTLGGALRMPAYRTLK